jgi:heme exporter protein C
MGSFLLKNGYKFLAIGLIGYALIFGLLRELPDMGGNMAQTSRNVFYHVPMWFTLYLLMGISVVYSIKFLLNGNEYNDTVATEAARTGMLFGLLGLSTGIIWSRVTWRELIPSDSFAAWWSWDPKQTMVVVALMIYIAYFILRAGIEETSSRARIGAVYNIFAAASLIPLTLILPRMLGGLHPGGDDGNPLENIRLSMEFRVVFYPSVLGFMLLSIWILELRVRLSMLYNRMFDAE